MRLTLRTLLAYMDDILELEDAQDIAKKVQESERASQLLHRIRDVTQRLRLAAPDVAERGEDLDPNTVAEYLDNTLPADRVLDFEKVCLDSDIHLAEVASCHQILTLVLGEPAEVDPEGRQRMYQVPKLALASDATSEGPSSGKQDAQPSQPAEQTIIEARREKSIAVESPREARRKLNWVPAVLVATTAACSIVGTLWATGQLERGTRLGDFLAGAPQQEVSEKKIPVPSVPLPLTGSASTGSKPAQAPQIQQPPVAKATTASVAKAVPSAPKAPLPPDEGRAPGRPVPSAPTSSAARVPGVVPGSGLASGGEASAQTPVASTVRKMAVAPSAPGARAPKPTGPVTGSAVVPPAQPPEAKTAQTMTPTSSGPAAPVAGEAAPLPQEPVAEYISTSEVLVRLNPQSTAWERVPAQAHLNVNDQLQALPAYRPVIVLDGRVGLTLVDGTRVSLQSADEGAVGVGVQYGRLALVARQKENVRIRLQMGDRTSTVAFGDSGAELRMEVRRPLDANADPEKKPAASVADCYVTNGRILWQEGAGQEPLTISAPARFRWQDAPPQPVALEKAPVWDASPAVNTLDQRASATVERALGVSRPVVLSLRELADRRQREVRWLAMRSLAYVGDFDLMVAALNDPEQKLSWQDYIEQLREALTHGPESAAAVHKTMETRYRGEGDRLYELLWKYRKTTLDPQDAAYLVPLLDREPLAVRVLSFWNLRENTGLSLSYQPQYPASKRQSLVQKWQKQLKVNPTFAPAGNRPEAPAEKLPAAPAGGKLPPAPLPPK